MDKTETKENSCQKNANIDDGNRTSNDCNPSQAMECEKRFNDIESAIFGDSKPDDSAKIGRVRYFAIVFWENQNGDDDDEPHKIGRDLYERLHEKMDSVIDSPPDNTEIDVWIDSGGGDPHVAYKILLDLRSRCTKLRAVVPDYAKSAATLLVLGMDEIYMAPAAELGPLDVQVAHPLREELTVSALDVSGAIEYLGRLAATLAAESGRVLLKFTGLARSDVLREVLPFSAKVIEPAVAQLDPHLVHRARSQLRITREYAARALASRNLDDDSDCIEEDDIERLCQHLVTSYPSHGFVISRNEAREFGLPIFNMEDYDAALIVQKIYAKYSEERKDVCQIIKAIPQEGNPISWETTSTKTESASSQNVDADGQDGASGE